MSLPSTLEVCRICLDTESRLYLLSKYNLEEAYENITGLALNDNIQLALTLCIECAHQLRNCNKFRDKSLRAHNLLLDLVKEHEIITVQDVKKVNRVNNGLTSNLVEKLFGPDHCDSYFLECTDYSKKIELDEVVHTSVNEVEVKHEKADGIVFVLRPIKECCNDNAAEQNLKYNDDVDKNHVFADNDRKDEFHRHFVIEKPKEFHDDEVGNVYDAAFTNEYDIKVDILDDIVDYGDDSKVKIYNDSVDDKEGIKFVPSKIRSTNNEKDITSKDSNKPTKTKPKRKPAAKDTFDNKDIINLVSSKLKITRNVKGVTSKGRKKPAKAMTKLPSCFELKLFKVHALSYEEQLDEMKKRQETTNYKRSQYKCTLCFKGFINKNSFSRHMVKHTDKCGEMACAICSQYFANRMKLIEHLKRTHLTTYSCKSCVFVTKIRQSAYFHERWHNGTKYKCAKCGDQFDIISTYMSHLRIKHPSDHVCTLCGYTFLSQKGVSDHQLSKHRFESTENLQGPECILCNIRFASEAAYNQHVKISPKHSAEGSGVRNAPKVIRERNPDCEDNFDEPITCEQCEIQVKNFSAYTSHFRKFHPGKNRTIFAPAQTRCMCEVCGRHFQNQHLLGYHMAVHAGKQLQCEVCEKRFSQKYKLSQHMRVHSDNRQMFECTVCKKNFTFKGNRDRHMWTHNKKSFQCQVCDKVFATSNEMRVHVSHVHLKEPCPKRSQGNRSKASLTKLKDDTNVALDDGNLSALVFPQCCKQKPLERDRENNAT